MIIAEMNRISNGYQRKNKAYNTISQTRPSQKPVYITAINPQNQPPHKQPNPRPLSKCQPPSNRPRLLRIPRIIYILHIQAISHVLRALRRSRIAHCRARLRIRIHPQHPIAAGLQCGRHVRVRVGRLVERDHGVVLCAGAEGGERIARIVAFGGLGEGCCCVGWEVHGDALCPGSCRWAEGLCLKLLWWVLV